MEQVFFNVPLSKLEPIFKRWVREANEEKNFTKENLSNTEDFTNVQGAADFLNLSVPTIYSKVSKGELPFMKRSKRLYFSKKELMDYIKEGRKRTDDEVLSNVNTYLKK